MRFFLGMRRSLPHMLITAWWVLFALLARVDHRWAYPKLYLDTEVQAAAAHQARQGRGFTWPRVDRTDWSQVQRQPIDMFAPGYARVLRSSQALFTDPFRAVLAVDVLALLLLMAAVHLLFADLLAGQPRWPYHWFLAFLALSPAPLHYLPGSDLWALSLLAWTWVGLMRPPGLRSLLLTLVPLVGAAYSRSAYLALLPLPGLFWLVQGFRTHARSLQVLGAIATVLALAWLALEQIHSSVPGYYAEQQGGFFPSHLLHLEPFAFKAFVYYALPHELALQARSPLAYHLLQGGSHLLSVGVLALAGWLAVARWRDPRGRMPRFFQLLALTAGLVVGLLIQQSLTKPPETWNEVGLWTFVMEPRYYAPVMLGLVMGLFAGVAPPSPIHLRRIVFLWLASVTLAAWSYPLWLKWRLHGQGRLAGTFYADGRPAFVRQLEAVGDTAQLPLVAACPGSSQAPAMVGVPTVAYEDLAQYQATHSIWLATYPDAPLPLPQAQLVAKESALWLWHLPPAGKPGAEQR
jgi:hypothetical protein